MGSTPYPGTIQDLTFNLFSILADNRLLANALFWITVWITAKVRGPWTADRGYWSIFLPRFGCLLGGRADIGCRLLRLGPCFWDWRLKSAQLSKVGSLSEQFALLEAFQQMFCLTYLPRQVLWTRRPYQRPLFCLLPDRHT
jgi:hypothetical protein